MLIKRLIIYTALLGGAYQSLAHAQQPPVREGRHLIDGSKTPDLIPDSMAFRLVLSGFAEPANPTPEQAARQRRKLANIAKTDADLKAFSAVLAGFQERYAEMRKQYQKNPSLKFGSPYAPSRDALVADTMDQLNQKITSDTMIRFRAYVMNAKARMVISRSN